MPKTLRYREVITRLLAHDERFTILEGRGKGSERIIEHPDVGGRRAICTITHHGSSTPIGPGLLTAIIRRFQLPRGFFD